MLHWINPPSLPPPFSPKPCSTTTNPSCDDNREPMPLPANFNSVHQRIAAACARAGRDPAEVTLVAVSKGQPPEIVRAAAELGQTVFGENRVQEARAKMEECPGHLRWHLIGHLQSNKCRAAVQLFEMIQ